LGRVTQLTGRPGWYCEWTDGRGRRKRRRAHGTREDARQILRELEAKADRDRLALPHDAPTEEPSLQELSIAWRDFILTRRRPTTWESYECGLREVFGWLAGRGNPLRRVADLRIEDVDAYAAWKLQQGAAARTVNMRVGAIRALLNWAVNEGRILHNPLARWRPLAGEKKRQRRSLTEWEVSKLLLHSPPEFADVWRFLLGTGLRSGELANLEWDDVDWRARAIHVRGETSKSKRNRTIPLRDDLIAVLRRQAGHKGTRKARAAEHVAQCGTALTEAPTDAGRAKRQKRLATAQRTVADAERLVFTNTRGGHWRRDLARRLKPCLDAAGLDARVDVHTLRHTFGSLLIRAGADIKTVQSLLGHSSAMVTLDIYAHHFDDRQREAVDLLPLPAGVGTAPSAHRTRATGS